MKATFLIAALAILMGSASYAQKKTAGNNGKIGKLSITAFNSINANGNRMVSAIKPNSTALSEADQQLLMQVAAGGQRQLALSQAIVDKATNPQVKLLARRKWKSKRM